MKEIEDIAEEILAKSRKLGQLMLLDDPCWSAIRAHYTYYSPFCIPMNEVPIACEIVRYAAARPKHKGSKDDSPNMTEVVLFLSAAEEYGIVSLNKNEESRVEIVKFLEREIGQPFANRKNFFDDYYKPVKELSARKEARYKFYLKLLETIGIKPRL